MKAKCPNCKRQYDVKKELGAYDDKHKFLYHGMQATVKCSDCSTVFDVDFLKRRRLMNPFRKKFAASSKERK